MRHIALASGLLVMVGPFAWMLLTSLKTLGEALQVPPTLLPATPQWSNYAAVLDALPFAQLYANTTIVAGVRAAVQVALCSLAGYAFARIPFPGRDALFLLVLAALAIPAPLLTLPHYQLVGRLGWLNSLHGLALPGLFSAFGTFWLRQSFLAIPNDLPEAAELDGANHWQTYRHVMLPLVGPSLVGLAVITVVWSWNELLWPLVVNSSPDRMTLAAGLASLQGQHATNIPLLMAGVVLAVLPPLTLFVLGQAVLACRQKQ